MMGPVADITKLMKERDEARDELERLKISNRALCFYNEYLRQRLQELEGKLDKSKG